MMSMHVSLLEGPLAVCREACRKRTACAPVALRGGESPLHAPNVHPLDERAPPATQR